MGETHAQPHGTPDTGGHDGTPLHVTVFVGGFAPHTRAYDSVIGDSILVAADSGWEHAVASGRMPHVLVGDMDSISPDHLRQARETNTRIVTHPAEKDETDTEIALATARGMGASRITVVAGGGDRPDHVFAMLHSLASPDLSRTEVDGWLGATRFMVCRTDRPARLGTTTGDTVSLLPVGGDAVVSTGNLQWPLDHGTLHAHASRGMSNRATGPAHVTVHSGVLIAFITEGDGE